MGGSNPLAKGSIPLRPAKFKDCVWVQFKINAPLGKLAKPLSLEVSVSRFESEVGYQKWACSLTVKALGS